MFQRKKTAQLFFIPFQRHYHGPHAYVPLGHTCLYGPYASREAIIEVVGDLIEKKMLETHSQGILIIGGANFEKVTLREVRAELEKKKACH